jgi:hypothetical protein
MMPCHLPDFDLLWRSIALRRRPLVQAPAAPGFTTLEVLLDGVPLAVRPRLFWE